MTWNVWASASDVMIIKVVTYEGIRDGSNTNMITSRWTSRMWRPASYERPHHAHKGMLMHSVDDTSGAPTGQGPPFCGKN